MNVFRKINNLVATQNDLFLLNKIQACWSMHRHQFYPLSYDNAGSYEINEQKKRANKYKKNT